MLPVVPSGRPPASPGRRLEPPAQLRPRRSATPTTTTPIAITPAPTATPTPTTTTAIPITASPAVPAPGSRVRTDAVIPASKVVHQSAQGRLTAALFAG